MEIVGFKKTNGQKIEFGGAATYNMEYTAELKFKASCYATYDSDKGTLLTVGKTEAKIYKEEKLYKAGDKVIVKNEMKFDKKEKGWEGRYTTQR